MEDKVDFTEILEANIYPHLHLNWNVTNHMFWRFLSNLEHWEGKLVAVGEVGDNAPLGGFDK